MIVAIDGPAASGKGTIAKRVAAHYGLAYLDTGTLYRAVARDTLARSEDPADAIEALKSAKALDPFTLGDPGLRKPGLAEAASLVAKHPEVREELLAYQRSFARAKSGAVLDGRDIGTVICPDADVKLFVTATPEERARRRYLELKQAGIGCSVHWRPLHLHPYYKETFEWQSFHLPIATAVWERLISLPIFQGMREYEIDHVIRSVRRVCRKYAR